MTKVPAGRFWIGVAVIVLAIAGAIVAQQTITSGFAADAAAVTDAAALVAMGAAVRGDIILIFFAAAILVVLGLLIMPSHRK